MNYGEEKDNFFLLNNHYIQFKKKKKKISEDKYLEGWMTVLKSTYNNKHKKYFPPPSQIRKAP